MYRIVPRTAKSLSAPRKHCIEIPVRMNPSWDIDEQARVRFMLTEKTARTAPSTIVMTASSKSMKPHWESCMKIPDDSTMIPKSPDFVRSPDNNALEGAGAAVCAVGSQIWEGNIAALAANPTNTKKPGTYSGDLSWSVNFASESMSRVPVKLYSKINPVRVTRPPIIAIAKYVWAALCASWVSSCTTIMYEKSDIISKNINVVNKSPEMKTPIIEPRVRSTNK